MLQQVILLRIDKVTATGTKNIGSMYRVCWECWFSVREGGGGISHNVDDATIMCLFQYYNLLKNARSPGIKNISLRL